MRIFDFLFRENLFYFPECINYFKFSQEFELYKEVFNKLGIKFDILEEYRCSGYELWESGYYLELRKLARENLAIFKENKIKKIFCTEPGGYKLFVKALDHL